LALFFGRTSAAKLMGQVPKFRSTESWMRQFLRLSEHIEKLRERISADLPPAAKRLPLEEVESLVAKTTR
jgi:hypothetical protein